MDVVSKVAPMRICMLGSSGFVGSNLTRLLLDSTCHEVTGIDLVLGKSAPMVERDNFTFVRFDAADSNALAPFIESHDVVVHLAAVCNPSEYNKRPTEVIEANLFSTLPTVRLCAALGKRLVYFSTCEVYGKTPSAVARRAATLGDDLPYVLSETESHLIMGPVAMQRWTYACAKQMTERIIFAESSERDLDFTIVRPFNFIGPEMDYLPGIEGEGVPRVFPIFMRALLTGDALPLVDGGRNRRTFIGIAEAAEACRRIIERPVACRGEIINIGNPKNETTISGLAGLMIDLYREKTGSCGSMPVDVPSAEFYGEGYDDCDRRIPSIEKAKSLLDWTPRLSLREVFSISMDYYLDKYRFADVAGCAHSERAKYSA